MATETEKKKGGVIETTKSGLDGCSAVGGCATSNGCFTSVLVVVLLLASYCIICGIITTADIVSWFQEQTSTATASTTIDDMGLPARRVKVSPVNVRSGPGKKIAVLPCSAPATGCTLRGIPRQSPKKSGLRSSSKIQRLAPFPPAG